MCWEDVRSIDGLFAFSYPRPYVPAYPLKLNKRRRTADDGGRAASPGVGERPTIYHGVKAENDAFRAIVIYKNQAVDVGLYPTAEDAARAYDRKVRPLGYGCVCGGDREKFQASSHTGCGKVGVESDPPFGLVSHLPCPLRYSR